METGRAKALASAVDPESARNVLRALAQSNPRLANIVSALEGQGGLIRALSAKPYDERIPTAPGRGFLAAAEDKFGKIGNQALYTATVENPHLFEQGLKTSFPAMLLKSAYEAMQPTETPTGPEVR